MTTPLDAWNRLCRPDELSLAGDPDRLDVICCEASERVASHIGIEYRNCTFNSEAVRSLRLKHGQNGTLAVEIRANDHAARIWVRDPDSREWIEVLNQDPSTNDLTFAHVSLIERIRRLESPPGRLITRTEARRLLMELAERAQARKTIKGLPRLLRVLGIDSLEDRNEITRQHLSRISVDADSVVRIARTKKKKAASSSEVDNTQTQESAPLRRAPIRKQTVPNFPVVNGDVDDLRQNSGVSECVGPSR